MKKFFAATLCVLFAWSGLWLACLAEFNDAHPLAQGGQGVLAAILFAASLLCAGWADQLNWKGGRKNG